jgi:hypothetical protein
MSVPIRFTMTFRFSPIKIMLLLLFSSNGPSCVG